MVDPKYTRMSQEVKKKNVFDVYWGYNPLIRSPLILTSCQGHPSRQFPSLKLTASLPLKMDGWNTILSFWVSVTFQGRTVKLQGGYIIT